MKDIKLEDVLPINAMQYFTNFIEKPDAKLQYLIAKGHADVEVGPWSPCPTQGMYERVSNFSTNLSNNALVKKLTGSVCLKVTETQRYFFEKQGDLHVLSTMSFGGSSLAESFSSEVEWIIHTLPNSHSEIKCNVKTEYKGFMFKGLIEKYVHQAACDSFHHWLKCVREKIALLQESEEYRVDVDEEDDDEDDDEFYDSLEMAPPPSSSFPPASSSPSPHSPTPSSQFVPILQQEFRPSPPLTATLPPPISSTTSPNHVIFAAYSAGRPALTQQRALSPPPSYPATQTPSSLNFSTPTPISSYKPPVRAWESASDAEKREVEDYKQRFTHMVAQTREREREWEERLLRMTRRLDAHARRTRWFLVAIAAFSVVWPALARAILRLLAWLWPLVRSRLRK